MTILLQLGDFLFQEMEIPEEIPFGGEQKLSVKKLLGGARSIDALGPDPIPIAWSGTLEPLTDGSSALDRARYLQQMMNAGQPVTLLWDELFYLVLIKSFLPVYRFWRIPYSITCEVIADLSSPAAADAAPGIDDVIAGDMIGVNSLVPSIGDSVLTSLTETLNSAVDAVSSFARATASTIASVLQPLNAARQQLQVVLAQTEHLLLTTSTLGGVLPGLPVAIGVGQFPFLVNAATRMPFLAQLNGLFGRIGTNLGQVNSSTRVLTVGGGNLYDLAAKEYGDANGWTAIAYANKLTDPALAGITTLVIPPYYGNSGGILQA